MSPPGCGPPIRWRCAAGWPASGGRGVPEGPLQGPTRPGWGSRGVSADPQATGTPQPPQAGLQEPACALPLLSFLFLSFFSFFFFYFPPETGHSLSIQGLSRRPGFLLRSPSGRAANPSILINEIIAVDRKAILTLSRKLPAEVSQSFFCWFPGRTSHAAGTAAASWRFKKSKKKKIRSDWTVLE